MENKEFTPKIKALFQFIEYLHSNIEYFNQYNNLIEELEELGKIRKRLKPKNNYKDKLYYNEVQAEIETKFEELQNNTANLIKGKAKELNVCSFKNELDFNGIESEIHKLKENFNNKQVPEILKYKHLYIEYRTKTHKTFLSLQLFFNDLDEITKSLFSFFQDTAQNEFEAFENKVIQVNNISEAVKLFKQGHTKFTIPSNDFFNPSKELNKLTKENLKYLEIILKGYSNEVYKNYLEDYFYKECKPLAKNFLFEIEHFYTECLKIVETLENIMEHQKIRGVEYFSKWADLAENGIISYSKEVLKGKTIEQAQQETIQRCEKAIRDIESNKDTPHTTTVLRIDLNTLTSGRFNGFLNNKDILIIKLAILKSYEKAINDFTGKPKPKQKTEEVKEFQDLILNANRKKIANELKDRYKGTDGKRLALIITALKELKILSEKQNVTEFCKLWNPELSKSKIQVVNNALGFSYDGRDKKDVENIKNFINPLIK